MNCPACYARLDDAVDTGAGVQCPGCNHLWQVDGDTARATNGRLDGNPATAHAVAALIPYEVAR